jgi:hypothetical protein
MINSHTMQYITLNIQRWFGIQLDINARYQYQNIQKEILTLNLNANIPGYWYSTECNAKPANINIQTEPYGTSESTTKKGYTKSINMRVSFEDLNDSILKVKTVCNLDK